MQYYISNISVCITDYKIFLYEIFIESCANAISSSPILGLTNREFF